MRIEPYLFFDGRAEEAIEFYRRAVGAQTLMLMRFDEAPDPPPPGAIPPGSGRKIMHAALRIGDSTVMASDGECGGHTKFAGISLSLTAADDAEAERMFAALADGGQVRMPLGKTFFASRFGMLTDRFGVGWMIVAGA